MSAPAARALAANGTRATSPPPLRAYRDLHHGATVVVCGCGPSLHELPDPAARLTIGVNDVGRLFDPTYLVVVNPRSQFKGDRFSYVQRAHARALFTQLDLGPVGSPVVRFRLGSYAGTDVGAADVLHYTQNSPYVAVCLAAYMGAARIGLIGVDLTDDHFFGRTGRHPLAGRLREIDAQYGRLAAALKPRGIELVNLSSTSRLTSLARHAPAAWLPAGPNESGPTPPAGVAAPALRIVSYATTPVAGVPAILARCIAAATGHSARCVWQTRSYGNGVAFAGDIEWGENAPAAAEAIEAADVIVVHNGKIDARHRSALARKPIVTLAHNYAWNVDRQFVRKGMPGAVVGQYQATLAELRAWAVVPNPIPAWEPAYQPESKPDRITIAYTPSGKHERYPPGNRLYWHGKGYATTMRVLDRLAARYPIDLSVVRQAQVSHDEALRMKRRAHIVIDECVTGSYHRNSLEGLAAGCVVVNGLGLLPEIADVFRRCAPESAAPPFVCCGTDRLEQTLAALIEEGAEALAARGRANRAWLERHWDFRAQWERFWQPVLDRALAASAASAPATPAPRSAASAAPAPALVAPERSAPAQPHQPVEAQPMVSIVVPHGGSARLQLLEASLASLRACGGVGEIIVCEMGQEPFAGEVAGRLADKHVFVPVDGPFERARAINVGIGVSEHELVLWADNDILYPPGFVERAARELRDRALDYMIPFTSVRYLSEADTWLVLTGARSPGECAPVNVLHSGGHGPNAAGGTVGIAGKSFLRRYGGFIEGFRGWGGEDNAWNWKARVLGRIATTRERDQHVHHLYHPASGGYRDSQPAQANPYYSQNVRLLRRVFAVRTPREFLRQFPPPAHWSCPWAADRRIAFVVDPADAQRSALARDVARALQASHGVSVTEIPAPALLDQGAGVAPADALVAFGEGTARAVLERGAPADAGRLVVVAEGGEPGEPAPGSRPTPITLRLSGVEGDAGAAGVAVQLVPPLSRIIGGNHGAAARPAAAPARAAAGATEEGGLRVWLYWEGAYPDWIRACHSTVAAHSARARLLTPELFDALRDQDRDIDLRRLRVAHRADFVRAFLLARYGGLWIDSDCLVMQPLDPVLEAIERDGFVAHRERSGLVSNGFMGARPGHPFAVALYRRICQILRSRRPLGWTTLGSDLLTEITGSAGASWHELPCERIQPICWSEPAAFFATGDAEQHARALDPAAICYMLSNTEVAKYQATASAPLLHPGSFFSYLLERSLRAAREGASDDGVPHPDTPWRPYEQAFRASSDVYRRYRDESLSGPGSSLAATRHVRELLPPLLRELGVRSLVDAGCGDGNWMRVTELGLDEYIGVDLLREQIGVDQAQPGAGSRRFLRLDFLADPLPAADCILCRDALVHLSLEDCLRALRNFKRSGARYLIMTTFTGQRPNEESALGRWRPLNFQLPPFNLPAPRRLLDEHCAEGGGSYADKCLGVWSCDELAPG